MSASERGTLHILDSDGPLPTGAPPADMTREPASDATAPPRATEPAQPATARQAVQRSAGPVRADAHARYEGPEVAVLNVRVPYRLKERYDRLLADLRFDERFRATLAEVVCGVLHEGPQTTSEMRELVERWRALGA